MSHSAAVCPHAAEVPWRAARLPPGVDRVSHAIFGVQAQDAEAGMGRAAELRALLALADGPGHQEAMRYVDPEGLHCEVLLAYWLDAAMYQRWRASPAVDAWWRALPRDAAVGVWCEAMSVPLTRFQYGAGNDRIAGMVTLTGVEPSTKFGYWGGYRDRIPASVEDKFLSPVQQVPTPIVRETRGRRLRVQTPDNLCYLREGQSWDEAGNEEREVWQREMDATVADWVATLADQPERTGCLSVRFCREWDPARDSARERQSQVVFALSLHHIERAARTIPTHLAVKDSFLRMHEIANFEPRMHVWVEMFILKRGELVAEYVNCHPRTGLLPYFEAVEVA
ncbi:MAG: phenylacetaldoxime dehydratase family protein [Gammaproteobacteria bacterium]